MGEHVELEELEWLLLAGPKLLAGFVSESDARRWHSKLGADRLIRRCPCCGSVRVEDNFDPEAEYGPAS